MHNAERFIGATIRSVCAQTHRNIEVVVVDDGSTDGSAAIVESLASRDGRVRLLRQSQQGVAAARNRAIRESRGEFIAPLDADDIWYSHKLERQLDCMAAAGAEVGLVYTWSAYIDGSGRLVGGYCAHDLPGDFYAALIFRNVIGCASVPMIRRQCLTEAGLYNEAYMRHNAQGCEDIDLYLRIAERYRVQVVREMLVGYRQHDGRMSSNAYSMARSFYYAMRDCRRRRPDIPWSIFRWSLARQHLYLHGRARGHREFWKSFKLLVMALWFDPSLLLRSGLYRQLLPDGKRWRKRVRGRGVDVTNEIDTVADAGATMAGLVARSAQHPTRLFSTLEELYRRRLAFTERLLEQTRVRAPTASSAAAALLRAAPPRSAAESRQGRA